MIYYGWIDYSEDEEYKDILKTTHILIEANTIKMALSGVRFVLDKLDEAAEELPTFSRVIRILDCDGKSAIENAERYHGKSTIKGDFLIIRNDMSTGIEENTTLKKMYKQLEK